MPDPAPRTMAQIVDELHQGGGARRGTAESALADLPTVVPDTVWASLVVRTRRGRIRTLASTDGVASDADELQDVLDEGPSIRVPGEGWCRSGDVARDERWSRWGPQASGAGIGSVVSLRLRAGGDDLGALNLYAPGTGAFQHDGDIEAALLFAAYVATGLTSSGGDSSSGAVLDDGHAISIAQGILMERYGIDLVSSGELLRAHSSRVGLTLRALADHLLATDRLPRLPGTEIPDA